MFLIKRCQQTQTRLAVANPRAFLAMLFLVGSALTCWLLLVSEKSSRTFCRFMLRCDENKSTTCAAFMGPKKCICKRQFVECNIVSKWQNPAISRTNHRFVCKCASSSYIAHPAQVQHDIPR